MSKKNVAIYGASSSIGKHLYRVMYGSKRYNIYRFGRDANKKVDTKIYDHLIFLQGYIGPKGITTHNKYSIAETLNINLIKTFEILQSKVQSGSFSQGCNIVLCSSVSAQKGSFDPIYSAAKAGLIGMMKSFAMSVDNIRINCICPSTIEDSDMTINKMTNLHMEKKRLETLTGKLNRSKDIALIINDMCQDHWKNMTGACVDINGGSYLR